MSTKCEGKYLCIFLLICISLVFLKIYFIATYGRKINEFLETYRLKSYDIIQHHAKEEKVIIYNEDVNYYRIEFLLYIVLILVLLIGFGNYFIKQRKDHAKSWSMMTFLFGNNHCIIRK
tara:strand:+ start:266 stop:622 length:357 start_codon:yes stop_codon:yes gene_type:complete